MDSRCIKVPADLLAVGGDKATGAKAVRPSEGDVVEIAATGVVKSVEDGVAEIELETVNGEALAAGGEGDGQEGGVAGEGEDSGPGESWIRKLAARYDEDPEN